MTEPPPRVFANLGCGPRGSELKPSIFYDWHELRVDIDPAVAPDVVADLTDLAAIPDASVQGVWCSHCIEHLYRHQVPQALAEIRRILSVEGVACIIVPDLQTVANAIVADKLLDTLYDAPAGPITAHDVLFGYERDISRGRLAMAHHCGFTPSALVATLKDAGFDEFVVVRRSNLELAAVAHNSKWTSIRMRDALVDQLHG
jgi:hypothetical protein